METDGFGAGPRPGERVVVAMSGGVDSSVAAALLRDRGCEVMGVTLMLQACGEPGAGSSCCGVDGVVHARKVARQLGISHQLLDCIRDFDEAVLRPAWDDYAHGRTPSPCLRCNEHIKFGTLLDWSLRMGASWLATGHYARLDRDAAGEPLLLRGSDPGKDQSYFLAGLCRDQLRRSVFPVGHLDKSEVRLLARSLDLAAAETPESQDACLRGPRQGFAEALRARFHGTASPGPVLDEEGRVLGHHPGLHRYTVGQRRGLALPVPDRCWVMALRPADAAVVVTLDPARLLATELAARDTSWIGAPPGGPLECQVQIRSRHAATPALAEETEPGLVRVRFHEPVSAITPGQAAVLYDGERVLGRGWIASA